MRKFRKFDQFFTYKIISVSILVLIAVVLTTLASLVTISTGNTIVFGQGYAPTVACTGSNKITHQFLESWNSSSSDFYVSGMNVGNVPDACIGYDLLLRAYDGAGNLVPLFTAAGYQQTVAYVYYAPGPTPNINVTPSVASTAFFAAGYRSLCGATVQNPAAGHSSSTPNSFTINFALPLSVASTIATATIEIVPHTAYLCVAPFTPDINGLCTDVITDTTQTISVAVPTCANLMNILIVGGGGGAGYWGSAGGGGGGGLLYANGFSVSGGTITVQVGAGGLGASTSGTYVSVGTGGSGKGGSGTNGSDSSVTYNGSTYIAKGGGGGGGGQYSSFCSSNCPASYTFKFNSASNNDGYSKGKDGGSGGGNAGDGYSSNSCGNTNAEQSVSTQSTYTGFLSRGFSGATGCKSAGQNNAGGGGGGAGGTGCGGGTDGTPRCPGRPTSSGGLGYTSVIDGKTYAAGGYVDPGSSNTGNGGGVIGQPNGRSGDGGSGIVILQYP